MQATKQAHQLLVAFAVAIAAALCLSVAPATANQAYASFNWNGTKVTSLPSTPFSGSGTSTDPYLIQNATDLAEFVYAVNSGNTTYNAAGVCYKLTDDVYLNTSAVTSGMVTPTTSGGGTAAVTGYSGTLYEWVPIGGGASTTSFKGVFDGNSKTVYNIFYCHCDGSYSSGNSVKNNSGFFGKVEVGATVKNLTLNGGYFGAQRSIGAVAGKSWGKIDNCDNVGVYVYSTDSKGVGGICGANWVNSSTDDAPVIINCKNSGTVVCSYSKGSAGGIAGENEGDVVNCGNTGAITCSGYNAGGLVGSNKHSANKGTMTVSGLIINSYNNGAVTGKYAGGIAGYNAYSARNCYNSGVISGTNAGQIFGENGSSGTTDYLYYLDGNGNAVGTGTALTSSQASSFTSGNTLCDTLNTNKTTLQSLYTGYTLATWLYNSSTDDPYIA